MIIDFSMMYQKLLIQNEKNKLLNKLLINLNKLLNKLLINLNKS